jgi:hypothetical protein
MGNPQEGVIYAHGIACRWGDILHQGKKFSCALDVYGNKEQAVKTTAPGPLSLPKPRMGAGNASIVLKSMNPVFDEYSVD